MYIYHPHTHMYTHIYIDNYVYITIITIEHSYAWLYNVYFSKPTHLVFCRTLCMLDDLTALVPDSWNTSDVATLTNYG